jgi:membrane protease YdiL (CAAX protease family)
VSISLQFLALNSTTQPVHNLSTWVMTGIVMLVGLSAWLSALPWCYRVLTDKQLPEFARPRVDSNIEAAWLLFAGVFCMTVQIVVGSLGARPSADGSATIVLEPYLTLAATVPIVVALLLHAMAYRSKLGIRLGWKLDSVWQGARFAIAASLIAIPLTIFVNMTMLLILYSLEMNGSTNAILETLEDESTPPLKLILGWYLAVIAAPILEEIVFRGHFQTALSRWVGPVVAVVLVSGGFALIHPLTHQPAIFALSLCFGFAYERTGKLWVPILMHMFFNFLMVTIAWIR